MRHLSIKSISEERRGSNGPYQSVLGGGSDSLCFGCPGRCLEEELIAFIMTLEMVRECAMCIPYVHSF